MRYNTAWSYVARQYNLDSSRPPEFTRHREDITDREKIPSREKKSPLINWSLNNVTGVCVWKLILLTFPCVHYTCIKRTHRKKGGIVTGIWYYKYPLEWRECVFVQYNSNWLNLEDPEAIPVSHSQNTALIQN